MQTWNTRIIEYNGESHCLSEWSRILGIKVRTLWSRLEKMSVERAFTTKVVKRVHRINVGDVYGHETVVREIPKAERASRHARAFLCRCVCGKERTIGTSQLLLGRGCGCQSVRDRENVPEGTKFGDWVTMIEVPTGEVKHRAFLCECCACGITTRVIRLDALKESQTIGCGCRKSHKRRINRKAITWNGITLSLSDWSIYLKINVQTLRYRLQKGMSVDEAFTTPVRYVDQTYVLRRLAK